MTANAFTWLEPNVCLQRNALKHAWLENQICDLEPAGVAIKLSDEHWETFYPQCMENLARCEQLLGRYASEVSPASLLTKLTVFGGMSPQHRTRWAEALHARFLRAYCIPERLATLERSCAQFRTALEAIARSRTEAERISTERIAALQEAGCRMRDALDSLPQSVPPL